MAKGALGRKTEKNRLFWGFRETPNSAFSQKTAFFQKCQNFRKNTFFSKIVNFGKNNDKTHPHLNWLLDNRIESEQTQPPRTMT